MNNTPDCRSRISRWRWLLPGLLLATAPVWTPRPTLTADTILVPAGAAWKYLDNGTNQGTAWRARVFDDSAWASGPAELGYGDGDEATVVSYGPDPNNKYVTTYFRHPFNVTDPASFGGLRLRVLRDDGAVAYVNGTEVFRTNMPAGPISYTTLASTAIGGEDESTYYDATVAPGVLVSGANVIAVEIHQADVTSSDISFNLQLIGSDGRPDVTRGPYLQLGTPTGVTVRWRTDVATDSRVRYGTAPGDLPWFVDDATPTTEHEIQLTDLSPATRYYYSVGTIAGESPGSTDQFFVTAPPIGTSRRSRIWVLGDSGTADSSARAVRNAYTTFTGDTHTDLWLMLGDNAYNDGTDSEYQRAVFEMYPAMLLKSVLWPTLGNHDGHSAKSATETGPYYDIFTLPRNGEAGGLASGTEAYYAFNYGNIHFICLESFETDRSAGGAMMTWLEADLATTTQEWIIAFWHHPPYSKGSHDSDTEIELIEMRENAVRILEDGGVDLVLTGHSHSYERSFLIDGHYGTSDTLTEAMIRDAGDGRPGGSGPYRKPALVPAPHEGAVYVVAGSSGQTSGGPLNHPVMFISLNNLGSVVLDIDGSRLDAKFLRETGAVTDFFTIVKGKQ